MRKRAATTALAAAMASALLLASGSSMAQTARNDAPPANGAANPAQGDQIPVKLVVLYSSGVGYFEHFGTVKGNGTTELRFKAAQINDILKSLILQDLDKGRVGV